MGGRAPPGAVSRDRTATWTDGGWLDGGMCEVEEKGGGGGVGEEKDGLPRANFFRKVLSPTSSSETQRIARNSAAFFTTLPTTRDLAEDSAPQNRNEIIGCSP